MTGVECRERGGIYFFGLMDYWIIGFLCGEAEVLRTVVHNGLFIFWR